MGCMAFAADGRIPVYQPGTVIAMPGSYYLTEDLVGPSPAVTIDADNVTLDLNGHYVSGDITLFGGAVPHYNIRITNGHIMNGNVDLMSMGNRVYVDHLSLNAGEILAQGVNELVVEHCTCLSIRAGNCFSGRIAHNLVTNSEASGGIWLQMQTTNFQVIYNNSRNHSGGHGIFLMFDCNNNIVSHNMVSENGMNGINLEFSHNNEISWNDSSGNTGHGIFLLDSGNNQVIHNTVSQNDSDGTVTPASDGIRVESPGGGMADGNDVRYNTCSFNESHGISLWFLNNYHLEHNTCQRNKVDGFSFNGAGNGAIDWNTANNNGGWGFNWDPASLGNAYSHNRARANTSGAYNDPGGNQPICYDGAACTAPTNY